MSGDRDRRRLSRFLEALRKRHDFFHLAGCRLSDHGLETIEAEEGRPWRRPAFSPASAAATGPRRDETGALPVGLAPRNGPVGPRERLDAAVPCRRAAEQQHADVRASSGPTPASTRSATAPMPEGCRAFSTGWTARTSWPRRSSTISIRRDNEVLATMIGNFQDGSVPGKMQFGSGWWFLDQKDGMERQTQRLSNLGLLSCFVGMLTDSRSFLSYTRHEYFRRILCNLLGAEMQQGLLPDDLELVGGMVRDICYYNAGGTSGSGWGVATRHRRMEKGKWGKGRFRQKNDGRKNGC